jgi:hypothetical protein
MLRPVQSAALIEIQKLGGLLGPIGVGFGKTLISLLAPIALGAKRPLLLLPAKLLAKTKAEWQGYARDLVLPTNLEMKSYEILGRVNHAMFLEIYQPDLIVADECHRLKNRTASVTRRVLRYVREHGTPCVFLSGTITRNSLHDYWHLAALCLPELPMPRGWPELSEWANALDDRVEPWERLAPGPLLTWGPPDEPNPLTRARLGYQQRLRETPGVVVTRESDLGASLQIAELRVAMPLAVARAMSDVEATWASPDGYEFADALSKYRLMRQLALGFYYRWTEKPPAGWLSARSSWARFVRETITRSRRYDSELQVALACERGEFDADARKLRAEWREHSNAWKPKLECVWLDNFALQACCNWLRETVGLAWSEHVAFGEQLAHVAGLEYFGAQGVNAKGKPIEACTGLAAVLSLQANSEGRNLQSWCANLVTSCPSSAATWEQMLGRTHRQGQRADTVTADVLITHDLHLSAFQQAHEGAHYLEQTLGQRQKLLFADIAPELQKRT